MTNQCKKLSDKNSQLRRQLDAYSKQRINNTTNCQPETKPVIDENGCVVDDNNDDDNHQQTPSTSTPQFIYNYNHPMTLDAVMFGTYRILADIRSMTCKFNVDYIELVNIVSQQQIQWSGSHYWSQNNNGFYLPIHYRQIQKLMYDNTDHQLWQLLVLSVDRVAYDMVKDWMRFNDQSTGRFDTESNDIRERYIILKFRNRLTANKIDSLNQLIQRNKTGNGSQCVCQPITDDIRHHIYNTMM
ncbi:uncharacterized protein LOC128956987 [Oppia nitens]|uniref:uncharacterized protein LOC128956987 n=1 Tax=Oppia nitens TaxID=1686743 RepID=UPI0023DB93D7|nr:uncharacterized protein LOC128956987 [Oppia nitens]